jgi:hypothetical protein
MSRHLLLPCAALLFTVLVGRVVDRTTGQPLFAVHVQVAGGAAAKSSAVTDRNGRFTITALKPGAHTLRYWSPDVPPQSIDLTVHGARQSITITACSTTLDYSCESGGGS